MDTHNHKTTRVLKHIVKSKILIDCWVKDKEIGLVPLEIQILHFLRHNPCPSIVKMTNFFEDKTNFYLEMELHGTGMDLFDYIEFNKNMKEAEILSIFKQTCQAVQHLHRNGIVHRGTFNGWTLSFRLTVIRYQSTTSI